jgi:exosortase/archaeosortase family protein
MREPQPLANVPRSGASLAAFGLQRAGAADRTAHLAVHHASPLVSNHAALRWLTLTALALWPHWVWAARRLADGSDDPLGLAALAVLACAVGRLAPTLRPAATPAWAGLAAAGVLASTAAHLGGAPALFSLLLAVLALAAALAACLPAHTPRWPLFGLALLAMPVLASLQFYAGHPLRLVTAQLSAWLLVAVGHDVQLSGTALSVNGNLVIVDAPCSGVQMLWVAYFCACTWAWHLRLPDRAFARRLAGVGTIVLAGNVLRNSVLVALEAGAAPVSGQVHEAVGLVVLAGVCAAVIQLVQGGRRAQR